MKSIACSTAVIILFSITLVAQTTPEPEKPDSLSPNVIKADDFNKGVIVSPLLLIQGKVPGFVINNLTGNSPNPDLQVQVRGTSTLYMSTEPLYVVDGIPARSPDIVSIENIESIRVLKSLSETAPYGILGGNGVVIIQTKRDDSNRFRVSLSTYGYVETFAQESNYMSAAKWRDWKQDWSSSPNPQLVHYSEYLNDFGADTDWREEISQQRFSQAHYLNFAGGVKNTHYSIGIDYDNRHGIIQKTDHGMVGGRINLSQRALKERLRIDLSVAGKRRNYSDVCNNPLIAERADNIIAGNTNIISRANLYNPTVPVHMNDGAFGRDTTNDLWGSYNYSPVNLISNITDSRSRTDALGVLRVGYEIIDGLRISGVASTNKMEISHVYSDMYNLPVQLYDYSQHRTETIETIENRYAGAIGYSTLMGSHHFDFLLSYSYRNCEEKLGYYDSLYRDESLNRNSGMIKSIHPLINDISFSAKYAYKSKYFISSGVMRESSRLYDWRGSDEYFPFLTAGWTISQEEAFKNLVWLNEFTIRYGYGVGQRPFESINYNLPTRFEPLDSRSLINRYLHGEQMGESSFGTDIRLFSSRLNIALDYYNRKTTDGIVISDLYPNTGFTSVSRNVAEISNKGWEFLIKGYPFLGSFQWSIDFNISINKNTILSDLHSYVLEQDQPVGNHYGFLFAGYSEADEPLYINVAGDTTMDPSYILLGNGVPKSFLGLTNTFYYRNFELSFLIRGATGFESINLVNQYYIRQTNSLSSILHADPRDIENDRPIKGKQYVEKGDYLIIDNILLGYSIPLKKGVVKSAKLYLACNHLAIFTRFSGENPEASGITGVHPGYYSGEVYPLTRTFVLGLKVEL
ncbi:MAG: TonB-dependent receptor plug domain-containing protein [Bacteroidota bacterium]